jgi:hypothetical protein
LPTGSALNLVDEHSSMPSGVSGDLRFNHYVSVGIKMGDRFTAFAWLGTRSDQDVH